MAFRQNSTRKIPITDDYSKPIVAFIGSPSDTLSAFITNIATWLIPHTIEITVTISIGLF